MVIAGKLADFIYVLSFVCNGENITKAVTQQAPFINAHSLSPIESHVIDAHTGHILPYRYELVA